MKLTSKQLDLISEHIETFEYFHEGLARNEGTRVVVSSVMVEKDSIVANVKITDGYNSRSKQNQHYSLAIFRDIVGEDVYMKHMKECGFNEQDIALELGM